MRVRILIDVRSGRNDVHDCCLNFSSNILGKDCKVLVHKFLKTVYRSYLNSFYMYIYI